MAIHLGDRAPFTFAFISVLLSAFVGGFGPGLLAAVFWTVFGLPLFLSNDLSFTVADPRHVGILATNILLWMFSAAICHQLRKAVIRGDQVAERLEDKRERLSSILTSITDGFFAVSSDWTITRTNEPLFNQLGFSQSAVGKGLWDASTIGTNPAVRGALERAMSGRTFESIELTTESGQRWFHLRCHPAHDQGLFCIVQEISERKRLEEHREKMLAYERAARSAAEQASHIKDDFLATLSHELRTPLTSLFGWLDLIESGREIDPQTAEGICAIRRSATSLNQLIEELLDVSRINAGKVQLELRTLDLHQAVSDAIDVIRPASLAKSIEIDLNREEEEAYILADKDRIHQVFANILSNAVRFTPKGGHVSVSVALQEAGWAVTIKDNGLGIEPAELRTIFERFRQTDAGMNRRHGGLGLGLAIARQLVELHGGEIRADSEGLGKGSAFTVTFPPAEPPHRTRSHGLGGAAQDRRRDLKGLKIAIVEDDPSTREVLLRLLKAEGADVTGYISGREILKAMESDCPDLVISDIGMPDMDGYQMIEKLRSIGGPCEHVPAIALTAFARGEDRLEAIAQGFNAHLAKPVVLTELLATIAKLVAENTESCDAE